MLVPGACLVRSHAQLGMFIDLKSRFFEMQLEREGVRERGEGLENGLR